MCGQSNNKQGKCLWPTMISKYLKSIFYKWYLSCGMLVRYTYIYIIYLIIYVIIYMCCIHVDTGGICVYNIFTIDLLRIFRNHFKARSLQQKQRLEVGSRWVPVVSDYRMDVSQLCQRFQWKIAIHIWKVTILLEIHPFFWLPWSWEEMYLNCLEVPWIWDIQKRHENLWKKNK